MKITLYKNCKINPSYEEVYDNKKTNAQGRTALDIYLSSLEIFILNEPLAYLRQGGILNFKYTSTGVSSGVNIYDYNYMKVEDESKKFIRYCFIDNIIIQNEICIMQYSEDIFHSYQKQLHINKGRLTNSLVCNYGTKFNVKYLPLEYISNSPLEIEKITNTDSFYVFANGQSISLSEAGEPSERYTTTIIFNESDIDTPNGTYKIKKDHINEILSKLQKLLYSGQTSFEIDNYTIIPSNLIPENVIEEITRNGNLFINSHATGTGINYIAVDLYKKHYGFEQPSYLIKIDLNQIIIENDFKNISVGTYKTEIPIISNGNDIILSGSINISSFSIKILLNVNGKIVDVTQDFQIEIPYSNITGEQFTQRKISRNLEQGRIIAGFIRNVGDIANISNTSKDLALNALNGNYMEIAENFNELKSQGTNLIASITENISRHQANNAPQYLNSYGTFIQGLQANLAYDGIILKKLVPINNSEVEKEINYNGYLVDEIVGDEIFTPASNYDIIKFRAIDIYGNFPTSINIALKNILLKGIRINYV